MNLFDAIVIGGSFAGLSAAMQLARGRRRVCVIDAGAPRNRFATASHGFFAQDGAAPLALMAQARDKLLAYPNVHFIAATASGASGDAARGFEVRLDSGDAVVGSQLILAFGVIDELPEQPADLRQRWGRTVLHCPYCHGYEFNGGPLGVLNVSPMSVHQAEVISEWGPTQFFLNGPDELDAEAHAILARRGITAVPGRVTGLEGGEEQLDGVRLADGRLVPVRALYIATRVRMASPIAEQLGCAFDDGPFGPLLRADANRLTTVPGVYAAGDIARAPHNATWASADGVTAGVAAHRALIFPEARQS